MRGQRTVLGRLAAFNAWVRVTALSRCVELYKLDFPWRRRGGTCPLRRIAAKKPSPQGEGAEHSEADEVERLPPRPALWKCRMEHKSPPQPHCEGSIPPHPSANAANFPLGGSLGRGGKQSFSCIGFALMLLKRIYSFCIIFKISTNCYPQGFKKPLSSQNQASLVSTICIFSQNIPICNFYLTPERRPLSWKKAVLLPPLPAGCIWAI